MWEEKIAVKGPYDFNNALERLSLDPLNVVNIKEKEVRIPVNGQADLHVVIVKSLGTIEAPVFLVSSKKLNVETAIKKISNIFQWNVSLEEIHNHFKGTNLVRLFSNQVGNPLVLEFDVYNCLIKCIIHQQLNLAFAHRLTERFVKTFGEEYEGVWFYPSPEKVANISCHDLRKMQFSQRKAEYIIDTSKLITSGEVNINDLCNYSNEEIVKKLIKIRGVGPWTVQNVLLFGLGRQDLLPSTDIGILNAMKSYFELDQKPTHDQVLELSKEWSPYKSYASLYLWRSIEKKMN